MGNIKLENFDDVLKEVLSQAQRYSDSVCWALNPVELHRAMSDVELVNDFVKSLSDSDIEVHRLITCSHTDICYRLSMRISGMYFKDNDYELLERFIHSLSERKIESFVEPRVGDVFEWVVDSYYLVNMNYNE